MMILDSKHSFNIILLSYILKPALTRAMCSITWSELLKFFLRLLFFRWVADVFNFNRAGIVWELHVILSQYFPEIL